MLDIHGEEDTFKALRRAPFHEADECYWKGINHGHGKYGEDLNIYLEHKMNNIGWLLSDYYNERKIVRGY